MGTERQDQKYNGIDNVVKSTMHLSNEQGKAKLLKVDSVKGICHVQVITFEFQTPILVPFVQQNKKKLFNGSIQQQCSMLSRLASTHISYP